MKRYETKILLVLVSFFSFSFAGISGKIGGVISDLETSDPLPGVNIFLAELQLGAVTDLNGHYVILNIPPGEYTLNVQIIGYARVSIKHVSVRIDQTTHINSALQSETIGFDEITVTAEREWVEPDVTSSKINITDDVIEKMPLSNIDDVIGLQAGVKGLSIRGSSSTQTGIYIDGFLQNDARSFSPVTTTSLLGVSDIQVQSGGFNAEYGNIRSGIINIVNKEGQSDRFHGSVAVYYRPPAPKHFGPSVFDPNSYFLRPFMDTTVCWTGTNNGAWDNYTEGQYPSFEGWNAVSAATLGDMNPDNDLTPKQAQRLFSWEHRREGDITRPDKTIDVAIGGPISGVFKDGNPRFYLTHYNEESMFIFPLSRDRYTGTNTRLKINFDMGDKTDVTIVTKYGETKSVSPYNWTTTPTGYVLKTDQSISNLLNSSSGNSVIYMPGYYSPTTIYRSGFGVKINHMISPNRFYEALVQYSGNFYKTYQTMLRDTTKSYELFNDYFVDEAPYGYWGYGVTGIDGMNMGGWMNIGRDRSSVSTFIAKFDYSAQLNQSNQIQTGFEWVSNKMDIYSFASNPGMSTWNRDLVYDVHPFRLSFYAQDKLEFEGFIANIGLRSEYSNSNTVVYNLNPYDTNLSQGLGDDIEDSVATVNSESQFSLHPRLGVSFPITESSKLYFNYGHFYSEPGSQYRFGIQRESNGLVTNLGNPNLLYEKTIAYELGYSQLLYDSYLMNLTAYYKDVSNQIGTISYQSLNQSVQYRQAANNNYEDIRGFELVFEKIRGDFITGFINYTYLVKSSGYFGLTKYYEDPNLQRESDIVNPGQFKPHAQPYINAAINIAAPSMFGPSIFGFRPFSQWVISTLFNYESGEYSTYNPSKKPGIIDNVQWKDRWFLDMRISKSFLINNIQMRMFVDISNLTNNKYLNAAGAPRGSAESSVFADKHDYIDYMESLRFSWEEGSEKGNDRVGDYRKNGVEYQPFNPIDPDHLTADEQKILDTKAYINMPNLKSISFLDPRDIVFGITMEF